MPPQRQRLEVLDHSLAGETPASPTGWKPVPRREAAKSKRGARQVPDAASIELLSIAY
jgi:hypothetical protein